jgi:hypothetical protein
MRHTMRVLMFAGAIAAALPAQQGRISGPVTGYVFDASARAIRPVLGVPGAAIMGEKIPFAFAARTVAVSPRLDAAIAIADDGAVHLLSIQDGVLAEMAAPGLSGGGQSAVFSPGGSAAALLFNSTIQIITGFPSAPKLRSTLSLGAQTGRVFKGMESSRALPRASSLSVSDDGEYVLFGAADAVRLLGANGEDRELTAASSDALAAFAPGSRDAVIADRQTGLLLFRNAAGTPLRQVLAPKETAAAASGVSFSNDGTSVLMTNEGSAILVFDTATGASSTISCDCRPGGLARMGRVFRLNSLGSGPLWLLDAAAAEPRTVFVPAVSAN